MLLPETRYARKERCPILKRRRNQVVLKVYKTNLSGGFYDVANQVDEEVITLLQLTESKFYGVDV